jgi:hypothetical protein
MVFLNLHWGSMQHAAAWQKDRNNKHAKADWQFTTADARIKLKRLYPTL